jgi:hypothetical protein
MHELTTISNELTHVPYNEHRAKCPFSIDGGRSRVIDLLSIFSTSSTLIQIDLLPIGDL